MDAVDSLEEELLVLLLLLLLGHGHLDLWLSLDALPLLLLALGTLDRLTPLPVGLVTNVILVVCAGLALGLGVVGMVVIWALLAETESLPDALLSSSAAEQERPVLLVLMSSSPAGPSLRTEKRPPDSSSPVSP